MPSDIATLARRMLDEQELLLAAHLTFILEDDSLDAGRFVEAIIPVYWETVGNHQQTLDPDPIFRPLYYVEGYAGTHDFGRFTRIFIDVASAHIEGCLKWLTPSPPQHRGGYGLFGELVVRLRDPGILDASLAENLLFFNKIVNVPSKHFGALFTEHSRLDERTFSIEDAAFSLIMTRKLSIQLFDLLVARGVPLKHHWPPFRPEWLTWKPLIEERRPNQRDKSDVETAS